MTKPICSGLGGEGRCGWSDSRGFTLIELLIVVAIIAILAAIAVPNFLEAQTRAKVSRVRADLRSIATALEAYAVDNNDYPPNDGLYNVVPIQLTTPVAFISDAKLVDPFSITLIDPNYGLLARYYTYDRIVNWEEFQRAVLAGKNPPMEAVDYLGFNPGAKEKYGEWRMVSNGPDQKYSDPARFSTDQPLYGADILYDPTNGTVSWGNLLRTQKETEGKNQ